MPSPSERHEAEDPDNHRSDEEVAGVQRPVPNAVVIADAPKRRSAAPRRDPTPRSNVRVSSQDGAAELCIIDHTYALVATGVGKLEVSLPAGEYQLQQRVGDDEQIQTLAVLTGGGENEVVLPLLAFPSPIPLPGTALVGSLGAEAKRMENASGNFRLLLWTPHAAISPEDRKPARDRVEAQLNRLKLECFLTGLPQEFVVVEPDENDLANSVSALVTMNLNPGPYVLIQQGSANRQRCMPVWIFPGFVTALYLLVLQADGEDVPVKLDHAGLAFLAAEDFKKDYGSSLLQLESARKALSMGRPAHAWTVHSVEMREISSVQNPLLSLMDAQLLAGGTAASRPDVVQHYASVAAGLLGNDFPDVVALRTLAKAEMEKPSIEQLNLQGPPLLRSSWAQLLAKPQGNVALGRLMDFTFQVDGTGAWLLWSEDRDSRQKIAPSTKSSDTNQAAPSVGAPSVLLNSGLGDALMGLVAKGLAYLKGQKKQGQELSIEELQNIELKQVSVDDVVHMLVALLDSGLLPRLLAKGEQLAADKGVWFNQDAMRQLATSLQVLSDKTLVKAMGAENLVRQTLNSFGLPEDKIVGLARSLIAFLMEKVSKQDRILALNTLEAVLNLAGAWLNQQDKVPALTNKADLGP